MARSVDNIFTQGISGMIAGQMIFKRWNGKTYVCKSPRKPSKQSKLQQENRTKFRRATAFAKMMMKDPAKKAEYKEIAEHLMLPNAYTAAVTDYMRKPEILEVEVEEREAMEVKVMARKKGFEIQEVEVVFLNSNGKIIRENKCLRSWGVHWIYRGPRPIEERVSLLVRVHDVAGNTVELRRSGYPANTQKEE
jgi:hypothetical protein